MEKNPKIKGNLLIELDFWKFEIIRFDLRLNKILMNKSNSYTIFILLTLDIRMLIVSHKSIDKSMVSKYSLFSLMIFDWLPLFVCFEDWDVKVSQLLVTL